MEIRFRVWCVNKKQWETGKCYIDSYGCVYDDFHRVKEETHIVSLCTGVKDIKGNLIYEGDILKVINGSINGIGLSNKWEVKWVDNGWNISQWSFDCTHSYEIIGNIYQNKELLNGKKGE